MCVVPTLKWVGHWDADSLKAEFTSRTEYKNYPPFTEGGLERFASTFQSL